MKGASAPGAAEKKVPYISWTDGTRLSEAHIGVLQKLSRKYIIKGTKAFIASSTAAEENNPKQLAEAITTLINAPAKVHNFH